MKEDENEHKTSRAKDNAAGDYNKNNRKQEKTEGGKKFSLLQSSKDRLRRRLNEKVSGFGPIVCVGRDSCGKIISDWLMHGKV